MDQRGGQGHTLASRILTLTCLTTLIDCFTKKEIFLLLFHAFARPFCKFTLLVSLSLGVSVDVSFGFSPSLHVELADIAVPVSQCQ